MNLTLDNVSVSIKGTPILHGVSYTCTRGSVAFMGENGSGKTTLLRTIATLQPAAAGTITLSGVNYSGASLREIRAQLGFLDQYASFPANFTVLESLKYGCWLRKIPKRQWDERIDRALTLTKSSDYHLKQIGALSGGMARRAHLARAILHKPTVLLLDEHLLG